MGTTGTQNPTAGATIAGGDVAWGTPGNILASDDSDATAALTTLNNISNWLKADGFDFSSIPANSVIARVIATIEMSTPADARDFDVNLWTGDTVGTLIGTDQSLNTSPGTSDTVRKYVWEVSDLGGLTRAQAQDANFGVAFRVQWISGTPTFTVDHVTCEVGFVPPFDLSGQTNYFLSPFAWILR